MTKLSILVAVKKTIDAAVKPKINSTNTGVLTTGVKFAINPFDDIAIEEAIRLKEKQKSMIESIHAVTIGPKKSEDILKNCLAKGVDKTSLVKVDKPLEPLAIAKILQKMVEKTNANYVLMGKQAIDDDANQTGQLLAGLLEWPQASNASKIEVNEAEGTVKVHQEIDGGSSIVEAAFPIVVTTDLRLNTPRYVSLPKLMKAKKKPSAVIELKDLGLEKAEEDSRLEVLGVREPEKRPAGKFVGSVDELVEELAKRKLV